MREPIRATDHDAAGDPGPLWQTPNGERLEEGRWYFAVTEKVGRRIKWSFTGPFDSEAAAREADHA